MSGAGEVKRVFVATDHGAVELKQDLVAWIRTRHGLEVVDFGVHGSDAVDYPDLAATLCQALLAGGPGDRGILLCGTGIGMSMAANRWSGIRAALCHDEFGARLSRQHNDANVLVLGGRVTGVAVARAMVDVWLREPFEGGRHQRRLDKLEHPGAVRPA
ncbi:MAG: ribose 5-phosphate isomerase B [Magnetococcales bacterium]|nr:ribose 5-phosphate isomerase B [Magnetococcales bacterium]